MGFADISIQEIAEDFNVHVNELFRLCDQMKISHFWVNISTLGTWV